VLLCLLFPFVFVRFGCVREDFGKFFVVFGSVSPFVLFLGVFCVPRVVRPDLFFC